MKRSKKSDYGGSICLFDSFKSNLITVESEYKIKEGIVLNVCPYIALSKIRLNWKSDDVNRKDSNTSHHIVLLYGHSLHYLIIQDC